MYSKEEAKQLRESFWLEFRKYSAPKRKRLGKPKKWMMQNTGIKALDLKFDINKIKASVGIDITSKSIDKRLEYWNKLLGLKNILINDYHLNMEWDDMYELDNGKDIIRIALSLEDVNIFDKNTWEKVYPFFFENMIQLEDWLEEYRDIIRQ